MLAVALVWAGNNVIVKDALDVLAPLPYVLGRFLIVAVLLFAWLGARGTDPRIGRADWPLLLFAGLSGMAVYNLLFTVALERTSAFSVALLAAFGPIFALLFAAVLGIERVRPWQWVGVGVAVAGVAVFVGEGLRGATPAAGDWLSLVAAASFAAYGLATRPLVRRYPAPVVTAWSAVIGLVAAVPVALPAAAEQDWAGVGLRGWGALFYSSAISMLLAYTAWTWAIERRGVGRTVPYLYVVPIATGAFAALFLGETFGVLKLGGALLVLAGVALTRWPSKADGGFRMADGGRANAPGRVGRPSPPEGRRGKAPAPGP
jgi:drug/metabolite transporter (DMT)-like permease